MATTAINADETTEITGLTQATAIDLLDPTSQAPAKNTVSAVRLIERGITTAEYAVGILGAMAAGLLIFRLFSDNRVFELIFQFISKILNHVTGLV